MMDADVADYYNGERNSAYVAGSLGLTSVGVGSYLLMQKTDFGRGAGWPLVTLGALEAIGAISYAIDVTGKKQHYLDLYARDKAAFQREEYEHIHGTTSRFWIYRAVEVAITTAGLAAATYGFAAKNDTWKGIGVALFAVGLPLVIIDTINNNRALRYEENVKSFGVTASQKTFLMSFGGTF
jgi:hypothetical protein